KLKPENKSKYIVSKSEDPRSQILFQESDHGVYYLEMDKEEIQPVIQEPHQLDNKVWSLEFDGSYCSFRSGACVVLISPEGKVHVHSFKLMFENTNNTAEYEAMS
ncbi:hypothetical protein KI387_036401, partial [Taxus chinensis]